MDEVYIISHARHYKNQITIYGRNAEYVVKFMNTQNQLQDFQLRLPNIQTKINNYCYSVCLDKLQYHDEIFYDLLNDYYLMNDIESHYYCIVQKRSKEH